jgi:NADH-quinone oxidoreductase subunit M
VIATTGVIFAAAYLLWALQRMIFNRLDQPENERLTDLDGRELALMAPLLIGIVWLGLYPAPVLHRMESATRRYVQLTQPARTADPVAVQAATVKVAP